VLAPDRAVHLAQENGNRIAAGVAYDEILATMPIHISNGHSRRPVAAGKYQLVVKILRTGGRDGNRAK
jgi:hypothetical protein